MSGPPGTGILNRGPYNGTPNITGAPPRGIDGGLPSGKVQAGFRNDVIEPMANATATFPFFIAPVTYENTILENDILMIRTTGPDDNKSSMSNVSNQYGILARPLRLLKKTPVHLWQENGAGPQMRNLEDSIKEAKRWRCLGIVIAVGARSDRDRQVVNVAIRGRIGAPNVFMGVKKVRNFERDAAGALQPDYDMVTTRGDLFAVTIAVKPALDDQGNAIAVNGDDQYVLEPGTAAIQSTAEVPRNVNGVEATFYHILGTYIRQLSNANAGARTISDYLDGDKSILDRKSTFEIALRL